MFRPVEGYALAAQRHMYEFGTTSEQLAEIKVAASLHAQHNPHALLQRPVTVDEVLESPMISTPLHRLDCCVITDGGGAVVVVHPDVARDLPRRTVKILGHGEAPKHADNGRIDLTYSGAVWSGPRAFEEAGVTPADIDYACIYDSFTITVLMTLEDLGFCEKGKGGEFVTGGTLVAPDGKLPFNTDGGGLCNNHPGNRGGITKIIETVRQLREEAHPAVQVPDCTIALAHGTGGSLANRMGSATLDSRKGGRVTSRAEPLPAVCPRPEPRRRPLLGGRGRGPTGPAPLQQLRRLHLVPADVLSRLPHHGVEWVDASGRGTVYSFTVNQRGQGPWADHSPYVIAYVQLEEGPRVLTNIVGADPDQIRRG